MILFIAVIYRPGVCANLDFASIYSCAIIKPDEKAAVVLDCVKSLTAMLVRDFT